MKPLKPREVLSRLEKLGFSTVRIRGSHYVLRNEKTGKICVVPFHSDRDIPVPVLRSILKLAGLSKEEFIGSGKKL